MLKYNITNILGQKGITSPVAYFIKAGFKHGTAGRLSRDKFKNISNGTLEKLCLLFKCTPNDLLEWSPDKNNPADEQQPLMGLIRDNSSIIDLRNIGRDIPYDKLSAFAEKMMEVKKEMLNQK